MSIRPIDHNMTYHNTIYQSQDKQKDFNKSKETNAFLQSYEDNQVKRNMNKIANTENTSGKTISKENNKQSNKKKFSNKENNNSTKDKNKGNKKIKEENKGQKIDVLI